MHSVATNDVEKATFKTQRSPDECTINESLDKRILTNDHIQAENGHVNGSGKRRDSTQVWTPLLENGNQGDANSKHINNSNASNDAIYASEVSNNNDWNDDKLKANCLDNPLKRSNNNGSITNGKVGIGLINKSDELDPLTGLCKEKVENSSYSQEDKCLDEEGCGLFGCAPKWARSLASTHTFMVVFLLAYILQGMYMTYFVSVITTIEKLFQIKSRTTGLLLSASEMGQISTAMLLTYYAGRGHRPRWIACGMVLFSIAAFACALPHFIFGKELIHSTAFLSKNPHRNLTDTEISPLTFQMEELHNNTSSFITPELEMNLCKLEDNPQNSTTECNEDRKLEQVSHSKITVIVLCIFFASLLSSGIGQTAVSTLGIPYIDDNVASKQSAMYMAITIGVRILGPASGFIVGSVCTRWYVNFSNPGFDASDPRWIGAWWLGPVAIGSLMMLASIAMFSFPKQLRSKKPQPSSTDENDKTVAAKEPIEPEEKPRLKDFPKTVRRQLSNDILMFRTASCVFHLLPIAGLYTFLPKYLETQFRLAPYNANMVAAFCGILVMGIGIVASGLVILKFKPTARAVAAWIALTALVYSAGMVILMFVGCNMNDFAGYKPATRNSPAVIEPVCSAVLNCTCDKEQFAPICGINGKIYISSCHAGCAAADIRTEDNHTVFSQCSCIPDLFEDGDRVYSHEAVSGYCDSNCKNFFIFIVIFVICVFMHSTSEVGSMLLVMRCTHPKDKSMAMGLIQSAIGLFGNVPCPIIYGAVVDSACLIWRSVCGKDGACSLYDADTFRHYFLGITATIMFLAFVMDLVVWSKAHRIDITPEDNGQKKPPDTDCQKQMPASPDNSV